MKQTLTSSLTLEVVQGEALRGHLDDLAQLRLTVFREYPYLYEGSLMEEASYLRPYLEAPEVQLILVRDAGLVVGMSTAVPLIHETAEVQAPFLRHGWSIKSICYFGESVLLPAYRGHGLGHQFFALRESYARNLGLTTAAFCAVVRPKDHPDRPANYRALDAFWCRSGYAPQPGLTTTYTWKELGELTASAKPMQFWTKSLEALS